MYPTDHRLPYIRFEFERQERCAEEIAELLTGVLDAVGEVDGWWIVPPSDEGIDPEVAAYRDEFATQIRRYSAQSPARFGHDQRGPVPDEYRDFIIQLGGYAMPIEQRLDIYALFGAETETGGNHLILGYESVPDVAWVTDGDRIEQFIRRVTELIEHPSFATWSTDWWRQRQATPAPPELGAISYLPNIDASRAQHPGVTIAEHMDGAILRIADHLNAQQPPPVLATLKTAVFDGSIQGAGLLDEASYAAKVNAETGAAPEACFARMPTSSDLVAPGVRTTSSASSARPGSSSPLRAGSRLPGIARSATVPGRSASTCSIGASTASRSCTCPEAPPPGSPGHCDRGVDQRQRHHADQHAARNRLSAVRQQATEDRGRDQQLDTELREVRDAFGGEDARHRQTGQQHQARAGQRKGGDLPLAASGTAELQEQADQQGEQGDPMDDQQDQVCSVHGGVLSRASSWA